MCANTHTRGCGVTGGDDNTARHKHQVQESGERRREQGDGELRKGLRAGDHSVARLRPPAVPGWALCLPRAQQCLHTSCPLGKHPLHLTLPPGQAPCPTPMAWLPPVLTVNSGSPRASHSR